MHDGTASPPCRDWCWLSGYCWRWCPAWCAPGGFGQAGWTLLGLTAMSFAGCFGHQHRAWLHGPCHACAAWPVMGTAASCACYSLSNNQMNPFHTGLGFPALPIPLGPCLHHPHPTNRALGVWLELNGVPHHWQRGLAMGTPSFAGTSPPRAARPSPSLWDPI